MRKFKSLEFEKLPYDPHGFTVCVYACVLYIMYLYYRLVVVLEHEKDTYNVVLQTLGLPTF